MKFISGPVDQADAVVELDHQIGQIIDKVKSPGAAEYTLTFYTDDNGAWQDVLPDPGDTPFTGSKGTDREGASRMPAIVLWRARPKRAPNPTRSWAGPILRRHSPAWRGWNYPAKIGNSTIRRVRCVAKPAPGPCR